MKSGNLNFLEPSGPLQACNGTALPVFILFVKNYCFSLLDVFAKLRKTIAGFVMAVRPHGTTRLPLSEFSWNLIFIFRNSVEKIQVSINLRTAGTLYEDKYTFLAEKIKTHILCSINLFRKSCRLWDNVEKYCRAGQATCGNMTHAHYMPDK